MPSQGSSELAAALRDDLTELLGSERLRVESAANASAVLAMYVREPRPWLLAFSDVPALPALCIEGALEELEYASVVVGPCADGSIYLLGLDEGLPAAAVTPLIEAACGPAESALAAVLRVLEAGDLPAGSLPPWFRIGDSKDLSFAQCLSRLSLLNEEGDEDFLADRLRLWFERHGQA